MAFKRYANALLSKSNIEFDEWSDTIKKQHSDIIKSSEIKRIANSVLRKADPTKYLLSHATIVGSVDTYEPRNVKLGRSTDENGIEIDVKFPDFRIKPECKQIINNNGDSWARPLLLATYRTFIGASNYCEHIQVPALAKGFIVDAVARDLGNTCYVDILVATDRKHTQLINDIVSEKLNCLSMGCLAAFTICNQCGNVAIDDSQQCSHISYHKGGKFIDEDGVEHIIGELLGHVSVPNSNQYIEASWVKNPAFSGAVRRNFINADMNAIANQIGIAERIYEIKSSMSLPDGISKAAAKLAADDEGSLGDLLKDLPGSDSNPESGGDSPSEKDSGESESDDKASESESDDKADSKTKFDDLLDKIQEMLLEGIIKNLSDRMAPKSEDVGTAVPSVSDANYNDTIVGFNQQLKNKFTNQRLIKWATKTYQLIGQEKYSSISPDELIVFSWVMDQVNHKSYPDKLYKLAIEVGPIKNFTSTRSYLATCEIKAKRKLSNVEKTFLEHKGRIASLSKKF